MPSLPSYFNKIVKRRKKEQPGYPKAKDFITEVNNVLKSQRKRFYQEKIEGHRTEKPTF